MHKRKSSIHIINAKRHSSKHNQREIKPSYLLDYNCTNNEYYKSTVERDDFLNYAVAKTKVLINRTMDKKQKDSFWQEAVLNLNEKHTMSDVIKVFNNLRKKFKGGFLIQEAAIHRDEGVFIKSTYNINDLTYDFENGSWFDDNQRDVSLSVKVFFPGKNIFFNIDKDQWYFDKDYTKIADIKKFQIIWNYHAHVVFTRWDWDTTKMIRLQKHDLSIVQDIAANCLNMQRGIKYSYNKRKSHKRIKEDSFLREQLKDSFRKILFKRDRRFQSSFDNLKEMYEKNLHEITFLKEENQKLKDEAKVISYIREPSRKEVNTFKLDDININETISTNDDINQNMFL